MTEISSWVTGHHVYRRIWTPEIGEALSCHRYRNSVDPGAVGVFRGSTLVGHVPREQKDQFHHHLRRGGKIDAVVTGGRGNTRNRGLEVPVTYTLHF